MSKIKDALVVKEETDISGVYDYIVLAEIELDPNHELTGQIDLTSAAGDNSQPIELEIDFHFSTAGSRNTMITVSTWFRINSDKIGAIPHASLNDDDLVSIYIAGDINRDQGSKKRYRLKDSKPI